MSFNRRQFKMNLLEKIDNLSTYTDKLEFLNAQYLQADTRDKENIIISMIASLKEWGK